MDYSSLGDFDLIEIDLVFDKDIYNTCFFRKIKKNKKKNKKLKKQRIKV